MNRKFHINNPDSMKELIPGVFLDIHGNIFIFDEDAYISSYEDDVFNIRIIKRPNSYETHIINVEAAYDHFFGGEKRPVITYKVINPQKPEIIPEPEDEESEIVEHKSDKWLKRSNARYNYRALKDAYVSYMQGGWTMSDAAEAAGVKLSTLSQMCCKKIHVAFTDALDDEYGFIPHKYKRKKHHDLSASTVEHIYIEATILGASSDAIASKYGVSPSTVGRIVKGQTRKAQKVIEDCIRSGRYDAAKRKFESQFVEATEVNGIA